jgi:hypothetical protein
MGSRRLVTTSNRKENFKKPSFTSQTNTPTIILLLCRECDAQHRSYQERRRRLRIRGLFARNWGIHWSASIQHTSIGNEGGFFYRWRDRRGHSPLRRHRNR